MKSNPNHSARFPEELMPKLHRLPVWAKILLGVPPTRDVACSEIAAGHASPANSNVVALSQSAAEPGKTAA